MSRQAIDTTQVATAASRVRTINNNINREFSTLQKSMWRLNSWKGPAGSAAQTQMHELFKNNDARSAVMQNYTDILERLVNPSYKEAESENISLASYFK